jgi:hypothetical protein
MVTSLLDGNFFAAISSDKVTNYSPTITGEPNNGYFGGASALATELPNNEIMVKPSVGRSKEFITRLITILMMLQFRKKIHLWCGRESEENTHFQYFCPLSSLQ